MSGDSKRDTSKVITGGICYVRDLQINSMGAHLINPDRGHVADDFDDGEWALPVYRCKLCGCLFSQGDPRKETTDV